MVKFSPRPLTLTTLILVAAFSRIIPHPPNFSPLNAIALFAAAHFTARWQVFAVPLAATWLSDLFLNNVTYAQAGTTFQWVYPGMHWQYAAYMLISLEGLCLFGHKKNFSRVALGTLAAGLIFFLISNFGVWVSANLYPLTVEGLLACYAAGIPFYQGTLVGDVVYASLLFGVFKLAEVYLPQLRLQEE